MRPYCEIAVRFVIPAIRALVALKLMKDYGLTQAEVARKLGISQASVSYYFHSKRGKALTNALRSDTDVMRLINELTDYIAKGGGLKGMSKYICKICNKVKEGGYLRPQVKR